jgi:hypothetical protein
MSDSAFSCLMPSDFSGWPDNYRKRDFAQNPSTSDMAMFRQLLAGRALLLVSHSCQCCIGLSQEPFHVIIRTESIFRGTGLVR